MRTKTFAALTLSAFMLVVGVAVADKRIQLEGSIKDDPMAQVELKVIKVSGEVEAVKGINFKDLAINCKDETERVKLRPRGKVSVNAAGRFERVYDSDGGGELMLRGRVTDDGKKAQGHIETGKPIFFDGKKCEVPDSKFKVSKP
jgi:hypothetical protein